MKLNIIVDIGNTQTKVAIFNGSEMVHFSRYDNLTEAMLNETFTHYNPKRAIVSCVGKTSFNTAEFLSHSMPVVEFTSSTPIPIKNSYSTKHTLGSDRLAAAVGTFTLYPNSNVLAIGCGTAITYDFVTSQGEYLGGAISPGISIRFKALNQYTAKLPLVEIDENFPILANTTQGSILSGVQNGAIFEIDGYINALRQNISDFKVILTGGDANFFVGKLKSSIFVNPNLVLIGLNRILNHNDQ